MRAAGAAIIGAAAVGAIFLAANSAKADTGDGVDFDADAEAQLALNYYANALTNPVMWSNGQLMSLEGYLMELGFTKEATTIEDMRAGLYGSDKPAPEPLPDVSFIPAETINAIADRIESESEDGVA
jgi:hypothetical protein